MNSFANEKIYEIWDRRWAGAKEGERITLLGRLMFRSKISRLRKIVSGLTPRTVIEVGCGMGHTLPVYTARGLDCLGIDVSPHAVAVCRKKGLNVIQKKIEDITDAYDLVSSDGMLEHFLNFDPYAKHLMRISNRYVLLIQPNHSSFWGRTFVYLSETLRPNENVYEYNYRIQDFISSFETNGFETVENLPIFLDVFRLLLFQKKESFKGNR